MIRSRFDAKLFIKDTVILRFIVLDCTSQILCFLQIEGLWQPCVQQICRRHFSNSIWSLRVSVSHWSNLRVFQTSSLLLYVVVIFDQ